MFLIVKSYGMILLCSTSSRSGDAETLAPARVKIVIDTQNGLIAPTGFDSKVPSNAKVKQVFHFCINPELNQNLKTRRCLFLAYA